MPPLHPNVYIGKITEVESDHQNHDQVWKADYLYFNKEWEMYGNKHWAGLWYRNNICCIQKGCRTVMHITHNYCENSKEKKLLKICCGNFWHSQITLNKCLLQGGMLTCKLCLRTVNKPNSQTEHLPHHPRCMLFLK